ncbi:MAG TPA: TlpA disulfide reductase family protein [Candidatus Thermoplasmatota archaeon]|nr:TlpA disulfide reductase family protein [Candidatus Thermoplasmatota archaeon]
MIRFLATLALLLAALAVSGCTSPPNPSSPFVGKTAPEVSVVDVQGNALRLSELRGRVVVLDLMGVNCPPCREQMPYFVRFADRHGGGNAQSGEGVVMMSVDLAATFPGLGARNDDEVRAFAQEYRAGWHFAQDLDSAVGTAYRPVGLPTVVIVDANGVIQFRKDGGVVSDETLERELQRIGGQTA